jgi:hypothetical protein
MWCVWILLLLGFGHDRNHPAGWYLFLLEQWTKKSSQRAGGTLWTIRHDRSGVTKLPGLWVGFRHDMHACCADSETTEITHRSFFLESHHDLIMRKAISATILYRVTKELMGENDHGRTGSVQIISTLEVENHYNLNIRRCCSSKFRVEFPVGAVKYILCRLLFALSCWDY